jgi:hypothetical protein
VGGEEDEKNGGIIRDNVSGQEQMLCFTRYGVKPIISISLLEELSFTIDKLQARLVQSRLGDLAWRRYAAWHTVSVGHEECP